MKRGEKTPWAVRAHLSETTAAGWDDPVIRAKRMAGIRANPGGLRARLAGMTPVQKMEYRLLRMAGFTLREAKARVFGPEGIEGDGKA